MAPSPDQNPLEGVVEAWQPQGFDAQLPMQVQIVRQGLQCCMPCSKILHRALHNSRMQASCPAASMGPSEV